jgi:hypothetical protein
MDVQIRYAADNYFTSANRIKAYNFYHAVSATSKDTIIRLINKGVSFINYSGHGIATGWQHINDGIFTKDTSLLKNRNMYPFIISNACRTAEFSLPECFGNRLVVASNKGAVGFIGCSNDSYWDEDYYWTVGLGPITANPTYVSKGLGAYDRLFHTHSESPSDWYTTMGQIVHAGNLSVSASTSSYKKYYWETYNLVGDPSMIPIMGTPLPFNVSLPDTLPNGITTLSLKIEPFSYIAISHNDTLWDASFANYAGSVILNIPGASDDSCLVVITGQNRKPLFKTVYFSKIKDRYLNVAGTMINDSIGNNNKKADYGETFYIGFDLDNLGMKAAGEVTARLATSSEWVTINSDFLSIGEMAANSDTTLSRAFSITVSNMVPDMGILPFDLIVKDPTGEKTYSFDLHAHAPKLEIISMKILDENNDYLADPGEALNFVFRVRNYGSSNATGNFIVTSSNGKVDILEPKVKSGILKFNEISDITVPAKLAEETESGAVISLLSTLVCDSLSVNRTFSFRVGKLRENFESSSFKVFPWINPGPSPWVITESNPFEGAVSARSGVISKNGVSRLMMRAIFPSPDSIRFFYKVSSELNYDFLSFKLNGSEVFRESGESGWKKKTIPVPAGAADMEWIYKKDDSRDIGADAAWIDLVDFSVAGSLKYIERDLKVDSIITPVQNESMGREPVSVSIMNTGHDTINGFYLAYTIGNKAPVRQFFQNNIIPYSEPVTVTFNVPADMARYGTYDLTVYGYANNDDYLSNDTLKIKFQNTEIDEPLLVFPNPFTDNLTVVINAQVPEDEVQVSLVDLKGSKLFSFKRSVINGDNIIYLQSEISDLPPGIYYLNISGRSIKTSLPLIKMKQ